MKALSELIDMNTQKWMKLFWALILIACCIGIATADPTTEVHVAAIGTDGSTIEDETTVSIEWMEANLPVQGDGVTHYYHQGPVFSDDQEVRWDAQETTNYKDQ
jgi:hypothetical protein